jgi:hypothetical protein
MGNECRPFVFVLDTEVQETGIATTIHASHVTILDFIDFYSRKNNHFQFIGEIREEVVLIKTSVRYIRLYIACITYFPRFFDGTPFEQL